MATNNYFDFLEQNSSDNPASSTLGNNNEGMVNLTTRADAECQVVCDGDFLFLLPPNQIIKEKAPVGQHILQFISTEYPDVVVEKVVDFSEEGKNYLVLVSDFQALLADRIKKTAEEKVAAESKARAEAEEARIKAEAETIVSIEFIAKLEGKGTYTGHLKDGKPEGKGKVVFENGSKYEGDFHNGFRHGNGHFVYSSGETYDGGFVEDMRTGHALFTFKNGDTLEGEFLDGNILNKPNVYKWTNGKKLACFGWDGGANGIGVKYSKDGSAQEELWEHGKRIKIGPSTNLIPIDLGLSVKWSSMNFGSSNPEELGDPVYYGNEPCTQESVIFFGEKWRLPTTNEVQELIDKCQWTYLKYLNNRGVMCTAFKIVSSINGNSIILPVGEEEDLLSGKILINEYYWTGDFAAGDNTQHTSLKIREQDKSGLSFSTGGQYSEGRVRLVAK